MPRGSPLTPDETERAAEVYQQTGSYEAAGKAIGHDRSVVRRALLRRGESLRVTLHARALARGIRRGRRALVKGLELIERLIDAERTDGSGMEPKDIAVLMNATARVTDSLVAVRADADRRRQARLTRDKTRAETRVLEAKARGEPLNVVISTTDEHAVSRIIQKHFGQAGAQPKAIDASGTDDDRDLGG